MFALRFRFNWSDQAKDHVIAFKPKFNRIVLDAVQSNDLAVKQGGFDLFRRGLRKIYKESIQNNSKEQIYVCIFDSMRIISKQKFQRYLALGQHETDTITSALLARFAGLVPTTRAAIDESYKERFKQNEQVIASLLATVLCMVDHETWPIPQSLPPIYAFRYSPHCGFPTRSKIESADLTRWNWVMQQRVSRSDNDVIDCSATSASTPLLATSATIPESVGRATDAPPL